MSDFFSNLFKTAAEPVSRTFELRYLRLRNEWERYAIKTKGEFSEHSSFDTMYLQTVDERRDLFANMQEGGKAQEVMASMTQRDPKFMPVSRITYRYAGCLVRIQSHLEWSGGFLCQARVNFSGRRTFKMRIQEKPHALRKAAWSAFGALVRLHPTVQKVTEEFASKAQFQQERASTEQCFSGDPSVDSRFEFFATSNTALIATAAKVQDQLRKLKSVHYLYFVGDPDRPEGTKDNKLMADFVCPIDGTDQLAAMHVLIVECIDELIRRGLIQPMDGPDEVAS